MPFIRGKKGQRGRQQWQPGCRHCEVLERYQAARDAWEALRESGESFGGSIAGAGGSNAGYYQLSDEEFRQLHPMPQFKDFLIAMKEEYEAERAAYEDQ